MPDYSDLEEKRKSDKVPFATPDPDQENGKTQAPPPLNLGPSQSPVQKKEAPVQMEDGKDKKDEDKGVEVDIKLLPPKFQMSFWRFKLMADTGEAKLKYKQDDFSASLGYGYGSKLSLGAQKGPFSVKGAYKPGASDFTLGAGYKQGAFNAGLSVNPLGQSGSLSVGLGAPLLPMDFGSVMQSGGDAATNMMMQGPMAPLNDPMAYYNSNKDNIEDVSKAASYAGKLAKEGKSVRFGAGAQLTASQLGGIGVMFGAQGSF